MESVLESQPRHYGLLPALARGFTQYSYAFVQQDADEAEAVDLARATALHERARQALPARARATGCARSTSRSPASAPTCERDPRAAVARVARRRRRGALTGRRPPGAGRWRCRRTTRADRRPAARRGADRPRARARRGLRDRARCARFMISYEPSRIGGEREANDARARALRARGGALARARRAPYVSLAETVSDRGAEPAPSSRSCSRRRWRSTSTARPSGASRTWCSSGARAGCSRAWTSSSWSDRTMNAHDRARRGRAAACWPRVARRAGSRDRKPIEARDARAQGLELPQGAARDGRDAGRPGPTAASS